MEGFVKLSIEEIIKATNGNLIAGSCTDVSINGISTDSRHVAEGDLFIPIKGANFDAHDFIPSTFKQNAYCVLTEKEIEVPEGKSAILVQSTFRALGDLATYYRSLFDIPVVAITGSVGKTSTKDMIASVLSEKFNVLKTEGNFNNEIGLPLTIFRLNKTYDVMVLEMGMSALGEIDRLAEIAKPQIGVISNVGVSHIEKLGSRENILKAKLELALRLQKPAKLFINLNDDMLKNANLPEGVATSYFSSRDDLYIKEEMPAYYAKNVTCNQNSTEFTLCYSEKEININLPVPGVHNVSNALAAFGVGVYLGISCEAAIKGLSLYNPGKMRMEMKEFNGILAINDSYNASPQSMKAAFDVLRSFEKRRKVAVLGDMLELGDWSGKCHEEVGEATQGVDLLVCIGKYAENTKNGALNIGHQTKAIVTFNTNKEAIDFLKMNILNGDVILFKASRGSKVEEVLNGVFSE